MKTALITGVTGQDGCYLAKNLLDKGYKVYGAVKHTTGIQNWRLDEMGITHDIEYVDVDIVDRIKKHYDKIIIDCTHATQRSRDVYGVQGRREVAERVFLCAPIYHYDGIFAECHLNPSCAVSDGDCQIQMERIPSLLEKLDNIKKCLPEWDKENLK